VGRKGEKGQREGEFEPDFDSRFGEIENFRYVSFCTSSCA